MPRRSFSGGAAGGGGSFPAPAAPFVSSSFTGVAARNDPVRRASLETKLAVASQRTIRPPRPSQAPERSFLRATLPPPERAPPTPWRAPPQKGPRAPSTLPRAPPVGTGAWVGPAPRGPAGTVPSNKAAGAPTGSVEKGENPFAERVPPVSKNMVTDSSDKMVEKQKPLTRVKVQGASTDFTEDGGYKNAMLSEDPKTFWESADEDGDPPVPWLIVMLTQMDIVSGVYIRFDPADGPEDLLPVAIEMETGKSAKSAKLISTVTIDPNSSDLQPLMGPGITSGGWSGAEGLEEHERLARANQLLKEVFIVKLSFLGLRYEQEGHIRVRQVLVRSKGMTREEVAPTPAKASRPNSAATDVSGLSGGDGSQASSGGGDRSFPSGKRVPSASHKSACVPWADREANLKFQRDHSIPTIGSIMRKKALETPVSNINATVVEEKYWTKHSNKYRLRVTPQHFPEPIRSELDLLYSHPNSSNDTISQGIIVQSRTVAGGMWYDMEPEREFDGRWEMNLSTRARRNRVTQSANRSRSRPISRGSMGGDDINDGGSRPGSRGSVGTCSVGGGSRRPGSQRRARSTMGSMSATLAGAGAAWTEGDDMERVWWGAVAQLAPKGDRRVSAQLSETYSLMHGSSPLGPQEDGVEGAGPAAPEVLMMGGMGDSYRSLLAAAGW